MDGDEEGKLRRGFLCFQGLQEETQAEEDLQQITAGGARHAVWRSWSPRRRRG